MPGSWMDALRQRRDEIAAEQVVDIPVPQWTHPVMRLRVRPLEHGEIRRVFAKVEKVSPRQRAEAELTANAALIAMATVKVLIGEGEDQAVADLRDLIDPFHLDESATQADIVRAMMIRSSDVLVTSAAIVKHSGFSDEAVENALSGE